MHILHLLPCIIQNLLRSYVLTFAYAEALEVRKTFAEVHSQFDRLLGVLSAKLEEVEARVKTEESQNVNNPFTPADVGDVNSQSQNSSDSQQSDEKPHKLTELEQRRGEYGLVYIIYMRFGRRAEGIKSSRAIFGRARKDKWTSWHVYDAAGGYISFY